jgi:hypothetical protein
VFLENKSDQPITVKLPQSVATVHVLKQMGGMGGMGGGGMGGGGMGGGMGGGGHGWHGWRRHGWRRWILLDSP